MFLSAKSGPKNGRLKKLFSFSASTLIVKPLTLTDFSDCTNGNA